MTATRRFGGFLEFDRNGPPFDGTPEQRKAVRDTIDRHLTFGNRFHQTMHAIDQDVNRAGRSFLPVGFWPLHEQDLVGFCFPNYLQLGELVVPSEIPGIFLHELGHMVGWRLRAWHGARHAYPEAFRQWVEAGQPDGHVWDLIDEAIVNGRFTRP